MFGQLYRMNSTGDYIPVNIGEQVEQGTPLYRLRNSGDREFGAAGVSPFIKVTFPIYHFDYDTVNKAITNYKIDIVNGILTETVDNVQRFNLPVTGGRKRKTMKRKTMKRKTMKRKHYRK